MAGENQNPGGESQNQGGEQNQQQNQQQQGTGKEYLQFFPETIRSEKTLEKFSGKDEREVLAKLASSYINLEKMPRGVTVPKDDAPQAEWDAFYEKLGRPKSPDEYKVEAKVPEGTEWSKEAEKVMLAKMHARGLTPKQAQGILDDYLAVGAEAQLFLKQQRAKTQADAESAMKEEWGGLAERNIALVQRGVHEFSGDSGFKEWLDETGAGNDPRFFKFALRVFQPMMEDNLIKGENLGMKRSDAKAELDRLMKTPEYLKGDKATIEKIQSLYPIAHGE